MKIFQGTATVFTNEENFLCPRRNKTENEIVSLRPNSRH
jgi:hypothetical protein